MSVKLMPYTAADLLHYAIMPIHYIQLVVVITVIVVLLLIYWLRVISVCVENALQFVCTTGCTALC